MILSVPCLHVVGASCAKFKARNYFKLRHQTTGLVLFFFGNFKQGIVFWVALNKLIDEIVVVYFLKSLFYFIILRLLLYF